VAETIGLKSTIYYTALEADYVPGSGGAFRDPAGNVIYHASKEFVEAASIEGSAKLADGRVLNWSTQIDGEVRWALTDAEYGLGSTGEYLVPLRSAAVDPTVIPLGSVLFIKETVGMPMDDGSLHNGIWYAVDIGGAIGGNRIDLFAGAGIEAMNRIYDHGIGHLQALTTEFVGTMAPGTAQDGMFLGYETPKTDPVPTLPEPPEVPAEEALEVAHEPEGIDDPDGTDDPEGAVGGPTAALPDAPAEPAPPIAAPAFSEQNPQNWGKFKDGFMAELSAAFSGGRDFAGGSGNAGKPFGKGFKEVLEKLSQHKGEIAGQLQDRIDLPAFKAEFIRSSGSESVGGSQFKSDGFFAGNANFSMVFKGKKTQHKRVESEEGAPSPDGDWLASQFADDSNSEFQPSFWDYC
jgi:3D (Asp-Asp-Asp) domain-containing protein